MAIIIARSDKPIKEKHNAYRTIISDYPDMPIHETLHYDAKESLHDVLKELISWEEMKMAEFYETGKDIVYRRRVWLFEGVDSDGEYIDEYDGSFSNANDAFNDTADYYNWERDDVYRIGIEKECIDAITLSAVWVNSDGEITEIYIPVDVPFSFELIFFHLPVPFEKGDLVTTRRNGKPCILVNIPHWYKGKRSYEEFVSGKNGDGSDMLGDYYFIGENGLLTSDHGISDLPNLQYFNDELKGQNRFIKYLSHYIRSNDDNIAWLINIFSKFKAEAELEEVNKLFCGWYRSLEDESYD